MIRMSHEQEARAAEAFKHLLEIMRTLRDPGGCAWDQKQTFETMQQYVLEEAGEVVAAVAEGDSLHICEELGDLLMIIAFYARMAEEAGSFTMTEVVRGIVEKLIARHPHVFPTSNPDPRDQRRDLDAGDVLIRWQELKVEEKKHKKRISTRMSGFTSYASPMQAAFHIQSEATHAGFDFPQPQAAIDKIIEEGNELSEVVQQSIREGKPDKENITMEIGDLLFSVVNVARLLGIDPDKALKKTNEKFLRRFTSLEERVETEGGWDGRSIEQLDAIWNEIKRSEK
ncbi:MAG: nucleoside triphosphate pyrophosphohydrolase [Candidatus Riflebacteria bacterium]|nr:nucleoside triphosphate pyrophosphohydrolase [Candidatus Riflebacteria bacterium]